MKKLVLFFLLTFASTYPAFGQKLNLDSLVNVVVARNPRKANAWAFNKDSLFNRLPFTKPGAERVSLIINIYNYGIYPDSKQNIDMGYRILNWAKTHHDLISEAVMASLQASAIASNGDKAIALQLQNEAMADATQSGDNQALGIVYLDQNDEIVQGITAQQAMLNNKKAIEFSMAAGDVLMTSWGYAFLSYHYAGINKMDSALFYARKTLDWAIKSNNVLEISNGIVRVGYFIDVKHVTLPYLKAGYQLAQRVNDGLSMGNAAIALADYYRGEGKNLDSAIFYGYKAYNTNRRLALNEQSHTVWILSDIYKQKRNLDSTLKYVEMYHKILDQVNNSESMVRAQSMVFAGKQKQQQEETDKAALKNTQQRWVLAIVIVFLLIIAFIFWRNNRLSKKANALLSHQKQQTEMALTNLKSAQQQLIQSEKMASLGELIAGIAHEIQNPLNFVNNFSEVSRELLIEMKEELAAGNVDDVNAIAADLDQNLAKISHHGKRAEGIVKDMLEHSRARTGVKEPTDLNKLADEYLRLAYHGLRAKDKSFNAEMVTNFYRDLPMVSVIPQDIGRVLLNLFNNAFYAVHEKAKTAGADYKPEVTVTTTNQNNQVTIMVRDNGVGIPDTIKDKIMQPFFTTKPTGQGTGLGLSLSYDIVVNGHGGQLTVTSREGDYTAFVISIPV